MPKGLDGLYGLVREMLPLEPLSGHVLLFSNAQRNNLQLLFWDGSGLWVYAKRLEKGRFRRTPVTGGQAGVGLSRVELTLLLGGIDLAGSQRRAWFRRDRKCGRSVLIIAGIEPSSPAASNPLGPSKDRAATSYRLRADSHGDCRQCEAGWVCHANPARGRNPCDEPRAGVRTVVDL